MTGPAQEQDPRSPGTTPLPPRTEYVLAMTPEERISALTLLGHRHPEVFDEIAADIGEQRRIRARREAARDDG